MELLTGFGLATAAGLNAYIPLLALGLLSRFTDLVTLPHGWAWLENGWVMTIVAALLAVEIVAVKIPALDWGYLSWSSWRSWCRCWCLVAVVALVWAVLRIVRRRRRKAASSQGS